MPLAEHGANLAINRRDKGCNWMGAEVELPGKTAEPGVRSRTQAKSPESPDKQPLVRTLAPFVASPAPCLFCLWRKGLWVCRPALSSHTGRLADITCHLPIHSSFFFTQARACEVTRMRLVQSSLSSISSLPSYCPFRQTHPRPFTPTDLAKGKAKPQQLTRGFLRSRQHLPGRTSVASAS